MRTQLSDEIERQRDRLAALGIVFDVWDAEKLSLLLKDQKEIVRDVLGSQVLAAFLPFEATTDLAENIKDISAGVQRLERATLRVRFVDWAPTVLRETLVELGETDPTMYAKVEDDIGSPPEPARVVAAISTPPAWLAAADSRPWRILGMAAEQAGEWDAARRGWLAVADREAADKRAEYLVSASVAADLAGDEKSARDLLDEAEALAPRHPRVVLQRLDQRALGPERLAHLDGVESDDRPVAALLAVHKATAYMLVPDMEEAERYVAEAQNLLPDSLIVQAIAVNAVIHRGRIDVNEHRPLDYNALISARDQALALRDKLNSARRHEEAARLLMLAVDALTIVKEADQARALVMKATSEELATDYAAEVLGDAAIRAQGWRAALALTEEAPDSAGIRRIRGEAHLMTGALHEQNLALETLEEIVRDGGREAEQAALARLAATLGRRRPGWSDDAEATLRDAGFESVVVTAKAMMLARDRDYRAADELLAAHEGEVWADTTRLRVAMLRPGAEGAKRIADLLLSRGTLDQDDRILCASALAKAGERQRARDILSLTARDGSTPPAVRADAYASLVEIVATDLGDWPAAAALHEEWVQLRPTDSRASAWAPRIANRAR